MFEYIKSYYDVFGETFPFAKYFQSKEYECDNSEYDAVQVIQYCCEQGKPYEELYGEVANSEEVATKKTASKSKTTKKTASKE